MRMAVDQQEAGVHARLAAVGECCGDATAAARTWYRYSASCTLRESTRLYQNIATLVYN